MWRYYLNKDRDSIWREDGKGHKQFYLDLYYCGSDDVPDYIVDALNAKSLEDAGVKV